MANLKVIEVYLDPSVKEGFDTGLTFVLENGERYKMNRCQDNCVESFTLLAPPMTNEAPPSAKKQLDEVLSILQDALVDYTVRFLGQAGQAITRKQAENVVSKVGLLIALQNETLASPSKP